MTDKKIETSKPVLVPNGYIPLRPAPQNVTKPVAPPPKQP